MARRRTSGQSGAKAALGRAQFETIAAQPSCVASSAKPGSSDQATGTQRLLGWFNEPVNGPSTGGCGESGVVGAGGTRLPVEQAASVATIMHTTSHRSPFFMGLILLEALGALALLVFIVWWTMFSGRKGGEIDEEADEARPDDRPPSG